MDLLAEKGAKVCYNDPHIPQLWPGRQYSYDQRSTNLTVEALSSCDCILLATDHSSYDYDFILQHAQLIVDTRGVYHQQAKGNNKIVEA